MANKVPSPTADMIFPHHKPDTLPSMVKKIGKTTYRVWTHFRETSTETMKDKIKRMLREEVRQVIAQSKHNMSRLGAIRPPAFAV